MTKSLLRKPSSQNLLAQLITDHQLIQEVQSLDATVLKEIIHHIGLEDSSELLSLITSEQLQEVMDQDVWTSTRPGEDHHLDAQRFCLWIEILLEVGTDFAAEKISEMDEELLTSVLSQLVMAMDSDELALMTQTAEGDRYSENKYLEKALESTFNLEIEGYLVMSKATFQWETISNLFLSLQKSHRDLIERILARIRTITLEQIEEQDGLYNLLKESDMLEGDVSDEREQRREKEGFVGPSSAVAFLKLAQQTPLETILESSEQDHISKMYFRGFKPSRVRQTQPLSQELLKILNGHGLHQKAEESLLKLQSSKSSSQLRTYLRDLRTQDEELFKKKILELNFVANVLLSGHGPQNKYLRPVEAMELAIQVCDEALSYVAQQNISIEKSDILKLFKIGWKLRGK